jgi:hypothetical protein
MQKSTMKQNYCPVMPGKEKMALTSSPVIKYCTKLSGLIRNSVTRGEVLLGGVRPSWSLNVSFWPPLSSPQHFYHVERAMCTECRGTVPQYTVLLSLCLVTTVSHCIIIIFIINFISLFLLSPRKSKLNLFMAVTMPVFWLVPWLPRVVFQISLEHLWPPLLPLWYVETCPTLGLTMRYAIYT